MHLRRFTALSISLFIGATSVLAADIPASRPTSNDPALIAASKTLPEWAGTPAEKAALWRVSVRGPDGKTMDLTSVQAHVETARAEEGQTLLEWSAPLGGQQAGVTLAITAEKSGENEATPQLSHWRLSAALPPGWTVVRADWPILSNLRTPTGTKMAAPCGWGLEYDVKPGMGYEAINPSLTAAMPFVAFYRDGAGLYVGFHDKHGHMKRLQVKTGPDSTAVTFTHYPSDADTVEGRYAPPFDVVVGTFKGDYWDAAQIYRAFTHGTRWGGNGEELPLNNPAKPTPAWLRNTDLWLIPDPEPLKNVETCRKAGAFFGVPIALHWYKWHEVPYDTLYPEFFPPKPQFREGVKALQDAGFRVMPYINGRLCDPKSKTWMEGGDKWAARDEKGQPYTEVYGSKVPLHAMCPATPQWQAKIAGLVDRLITECGVDGVYIDQISAAYAVRCLRTDHGHSPGGGTFWVDGYRRMLDAIRAKLPNDRILTSEENAECWNDQLDALLLVNTPSVDGRRIIPLMPAVYGGRIVVFGFQYLSPEDFKRSLPFRAKMARAFLFGSQLGWVSAESIMADGARAEAEFLRNLARARHDAHDFLLTGRFLGEVEVAGDNPHLKGEGAANKPYTIDLPAVMATAWLSREGEPGIAVANMSDAPHEVELRAPWAHLHACAQEGASLAIKKISDLPAAQSLTIGPREGRVLRVATNTIQKRAQAPSSSPAQADRWAAEMGRFAEADRKDPPPTGAVLFIGSSSIRMWKDVADDFPETKVINRGFGGSRIADSTHYIDEIVAPYRPRLICLYAGDNDLAGGLTPERVLEDYREFVRQVRRRLPDVPIAYISIKPSPARAKLLVAAREANTLIRDYAKQGTKLLYIDIFTPMLGADGQPRAELFLKDRLHMNRKGYDLWKTVVAPYLK